jgi:hypothetical protein
VPGRFIDHRRNLLFPIAYQHKGCPHARMREAPASRDQRRNRAPQRLGAAGLGLRLHGVSTADSEDKVKRYLEEMHALSLRRITDRDPLRSVDSAPADQALLLAPVDDEPREPPSKNEWRT